MTIRAHAALEAKAVLKPFTYEVKDLGPYDVEIAVSHCGLCFSDIHLIDNDWGTTVYPLVPGHEIIGKIVRKGSSVEGLEIGQRVGVSYQHSACLSCETCRLGYENSCPKKTATCVGHHGGFADKMIADGRFTFPIPDALPSEAAAPLMCAGATVFAPLQRYMTIPSTVGIIGIGGLGHLALKFARAMGHQVIAISHSPEKKAEAMGFGAHALLNNGNEQAMKEAASSCDFILNTANVDYNWSDYIALLKPRGTLCFVGRPPHNIDFHAKLLTAGEKQVSGSNVANRITMREMLDFAAKKNLSPAIELFPMADINRAIEKLRKGEVRYRAVMKN